MTKAAAQNGWIDEERVVMEQMVSMKRRCRYDYYLLCERYLPLLR